MFHKNDASLNFQESDASHKTSFFNMQYNICITVNILISEPTLLTKNDFR